MLEGAVRLANLGPVRLAPPMEVNPSPQRAAVVAEAAFGTLREWGRGRSVQVLQQTDEDRARVRVATILRAPVDLIPVLTLLERAEAAELGRRLLSFVRSLPGAALPGAVVVDPVFAGCGLVAEAMGDALVAGRLVEVKSVGRTFRATDIRQSLTYAALRYASGDQPVAAFSLVNPRQGTAISWEADELSVAVAGVPIVDLLEAVVGEMTGPEAYP